MANLDPYIEQEQKGLVTGITWPETADGNIQLVIDMVSWSSTSPGAAEHRLYLDEMSPPCRASLLKILNECKSNIPVA